MNFYIHIPFCRQKCPYCKFALTPIFDEVKKKRYLGYLKKEIQYYSLSSRKASEGSPRRGDPFQSQVWEKNTQYLLSEWKRDFSATLRNDKIESETIYFWWWTPSVLTLDEIREVLDLFPRNETTEISFECNPEDITSEYIKWLINLWINRISLWVQSLNNETLKAIHRTDRESILEALKHIAHTLWWKQWIGGSGVETVWAKMKTKNWWAEREGASFSTPETFDTFGHKSMNTKPWISINIDFILGLPHSKPWETLENIRELHEKFPFITHTSVYMLEEGHYPNDWKKYSINEKEIEDEYSAICEYFDSLGWYHYEISNWAKPGYESRHNQGYWNHTNTRGLWLSATSYQEWKRWTNASSFSGYYKWDIEQSETLTESEIELERVIYNLRTFSLKSDLYKGEVLEKLIHEKYAKIESWKIVLTPAWIFRENTIIAELEDNRAILPP